MSGPASVVWDEHTFAVADPTQLQTTIRLTVGHVHDRVLRADPTVTVVSSGRELVVDVDVTGSLGATHTFTVR